MERRRGRPPHPDILTPREWEVLALLRQSLSNEQIAERLDISVPGVKYHVSEILSKLHVSSREEAAAWQPERTPSGWRRAMALPIVAAGAKAASIGVVAATLIAIGVVTWGVVASEGPDGSDQEALVPSPGSSSPRAAPVAGPVTLDAAGSDFTADHAIMYVVSASEAIQPNSVSAVLTTYEEARELTNASTIFPSEPDPDDPTWLVTITGHFSTFLLGDLEPSNAPPTPPPCTTEYIYFLADQPGPVRSAVRPATCEQQNPIPREVALFIASNGLEPDFAHPLVIDAQFVTFSDTTGMHPELQELLANGVYSADLPVWLVSFAGLARTSSLQPTPPVSGNFDTAFHCIDEFELLNASNGEPFFSVRRSSDDC